MLREALEAMPREERVRIVEVHMPRSAEELGRLLAEEWARRAWEALSEIAQGLFGGEWEEWPRHFSTLEECIKVHCGGLEKILLARLKAEGDPEL